MKREIRPPPASEDEREGSGGELVAAVRDVGLAGGEARALAEAG